MPANMRVHGVCTLWIHKKALLSIIYSDACPQFSSASKKKNMNNKLNTHPMTYFMALSIYKIPSCDDLFQTACCVALGIGHEASVKSGEAGAGGGGQR